MNDLYFIEHPKSHKWVSINHKPEMVDDGTIGSRFWTTDADTSMSFTISIDALGYITKCPNIKNCVITKHFRLAGTWVHVPYNNN